MQVSTWCMGGYTQNIFYLYFLEKEKLDREFCAIFTYVIQVIYNVRTNNKLSDTSTYNMQTP